MRQTTALLRRALAALEQIAADLPRELTRHQADTIAAMREHLAELGELKDTNMTPLVRFDLSPAQMEGVIREHLIRLGWTPPDAAREQQKENKR